MAVTTKNRKLHNILIPLLIVLALTVVLGAFGGAYAKYLRESKAAEELVSSQNMYFASDYLTEQGAAYTISGNSVTVQLRNYPDALRVSELDVGYSVTVKDSAGNAVNTVTVTNAQGTLTAGSQQSVNVEISGLQGGQTYTVEATGSNGFSTTLSATFTVQAPETGVFMSMEQTDYYVLLTVWTQNVTGTATIQPPANLIPDNTDPILAGFATGAIITDSQSFAKAYSSRTYRFFISNTDTTKYSVNDFVVTINGVSAVEGTD